MAENNSSISLIHDKFFQVSLGDKQIATDFFKAHLPAHIQEKIDFTTLKLEPGRFVDKRYRSHYSDVLYSVNFANEQGYLYLLAEHKSAPDRFLPLQLLRYLGEIWQRHLQCQKDEKKQIKTLPLIWPLAFYHGRQSPYPYSMDIRDCFEERALASQIFDQAFSLVDVTQYQDDELSRHGMAASFEIIQKHIFARDLWSIIQDLLKTRQLAQLLTNNSGEYFEQLIKYIINAGEIENIDEFFNVLTRQLPEAGKTIMTIAEQLEKRGREQGIQQGIQQGVQQGVQQGIQQGMHQQAETIAVKMLKEGDSVERVARLTKLPVAEIERLQQH